MDHPITQHWLRTLKHSDATRTTTQSTPNYWSSNPADSLISTSNLHTLSFGTGETIYTSTILPAIATAEHEVILVTCFWARSPTLNALNDTLLGLSAKALKLGRKIGVRVCLSSLSLFQKLFHTSSLNGTTYAPSQWCSKLGLPRPEELRGLDLEVKSIFVLPFSVMHPKFVVVDRRTVLLPSCNVSWENWFEGCVALSGSVVRQFVGFWLDFWAGGDDRKDGSALGIGDDGISNETARTGPVLPLTSSLLATTPLNIQSIESIFLPSPHHRHPNFSLLPWRPCPPPPPTPLNTFLLSAIANAAKEIYIQTPNLTSPPVLSALLAALRRGVDVTVLTSERLMILEQLVTAGTTTKRCVKKLAKRHQRLLQVAGQRHAQGSGDAALLEAGTLDPKPGKLKISYYRPDPTFTQRKDTSAPEPVQSHLKLTIIDGEWVVFGSGNMDRASWFTSQELGMAFYDREFAGEVGKVLGPLMEGRTRCVYSGGGG